MIARASSPESSSSNIVTNRESSSEPQASRGDRMDRWELAQAEDFAEPQFVPLPTPSIASKYFNHKQRIFTTEEIKGRTDVFLAGRGGEAIFHAGNVAFRKRVLVHTETYAGLKTCERGKKFARRLLNQYFTDVTFVVRHSYFFKNLQKGTISREKIESVRQEHGGCFDLLKDIPTDCYFTVGEMWILGIISDIVRFGGKKADLFKNGKRKAGTESSLPTVSDDESVALSQRVKKRARRRRSTIDSKASRLEVPSVQSSKEGPCPSLSRLQDTERVADQHPELDALALVKLPLPSEEEDASMFTDEEMVFDFVSGAVPL